ncbi:hypothetical protein GW17_00042329 [Ensete ventricosum]|nr:hypothetical protein GW17_00042329 [Ensete ventricosum]
MAQADVGSDAPRRQPHQATVASSDDRIKRRPHTEAAASSDDRTQRQPRAIEATQAAASHAIGGHTRRQPAAASQRPTTRSRTLAAAQATATAEEKLGFFFLKKITVLS